MKYGLIEYIDEQKKHYSYVTLDVIKEKMGMYHASLNEYDLNDRDYISFVNRYVLDIYIGDWSDVWFFCIDKDLVHLIYDRLCPYADYTNDELRGSFIKECYIDYFKYGYQCFLSHIIQSHMFSCYILGQLSLFHEDLANRIKNA